MTGVTGLVFRFREMFVEEISDGGVGNHLVAGVAAEIATSNLDKVVKM